MPTTSNFGWTTPADTDLVKDGAAAIRTLGNGVDSSFVDLKGGTTGQILSKNSGTDLDFVWIANDQGDITAVTAGTGISGGGTAGAVTITNSMATEITAKGDLIVGTGSGTFDNLPAGTNGHTLVADSSETTGLKWQAPSSGALTKISTTSFTSATSVTVDNCFSGTYLNYMVIFEIRLDSGSSGDVNFRLRAAGSDITANSYYGARIRVSSGGTETIAGNNPNQYATVLTSFGAGANNFVNMMIHQPYAATDKSWTYLAFEGASINGPYYGGQQSFSTSQCDGFKFYWTSASTGNVRVYGVTN